MTRVVVMQALCQCVATVTASAYASNIMNRQDSDHLVAKLYTAHMADVEVGWRVTSGLNVVVTSFSISLF